MLYSYSELVFVCPWPGIITSTFRQRPILYHLNLEKWETSLKVSGHFLFSAILTQFPSIIPELACFCQYKFSWISSDISHLLLCQEYVFFRIWTCQCLNPFSDFREIWHKVENFRSDGHTSLQDVQEFRPAIYILCTKWGNIWYIISPLGPTNW